MEQKEIKKITLSELIDVANKYESGEWDSEKLAEYGQTMIIRSYVPIYKKTATIMNIITKYMYKKYNTYEMQNIDLYKNIFFDIILSDYALVDCSNVELLTNENYDLLYPLFAPFVISYCQTDYESYCNMLRDNIILYRNKVFLDAFENLDTYSLNEVAKSNEKVVEELNRNKDIIDKLNNIAMMNDPSTAKVVDTIKGIALNNIKELEDKII